MRNKNRKKWVLPIVLWGILAMGVAYLCVSPAGKTLITIAQARQETARTSRTETVIKVNPTCKLGEFTGGGALGNEFDLVCDILYDSGNLREGDVVTIEGGRGSRNIQVVTITVARKFAGPTNDIVAKGADEDARRAFSKAIISTLNALEKAQHPDALFK